MESEDKDYQIIYTDYVLSGEIIGELNCLTNEQMKYSATCKTVVEVRKYHMHLTIVTCQRFHIKFKVISVSSICLYSGDNLHKK